MRTLTLTFRFRLICELVRYTNIVLTCRKIN